MIPSYSSRLFEQAFDTFKAFDDLTIVTSSSEQEAFPTSIWQILQHLLVWQEHQLARLQGEVLAKSFDEKQSWNSERVPPSQEALQEAVTQFKQGLARLQTYADQIREPQQVLTQGLLLQDFALHLSFHLGEVVLIRRLQGSYPLPAHMREFLQT
ncbi:DinB family protein [Hymenobacter sp. H14-R3]|uniref:DinB family protein n=1 Tax=Hymenobacter sp. H14-R3 TaxID=3046308 RepID=UPI0024B91733|nr:DinB family protein [Hymenobacter sp. H14-R3]MDJ0368047.1 DinB family protein [Hymenobacter sp. H14-R3]